MCIKNEHKLKNRIIFLSQFSPKTYSSQEEKMRIHMLGLLVGYLLMSAEVNAQVDQGLCDNGQEPTEAFMTEIGSSSQTKLVEIKHCSDFNFRLATIEDNASDSGARVTQISLEAKSAKNQHLLVVNGVKIVITKEYGYTQTLPDPNYTANRTYEKTNAPLPLCSIC